MFAKVLIANRGEIACRILKTLRRMNIVSVAVYSAADRHAPHVRQADEALYLGPAPSSDSYLCQDKLLQAALRSGAEAIHPGYGFLSESAAFADACDAAGLTFIGPTAGQMRDFGLKHFARAIAERLGVALLPGSPLLDDVRAAHAAAARIGYPIMLKSTAGGGGIGMQRVHHPHELDHAFAAVERLAAKNFGRGGVFLEKYIERARHIEVQIFGDGTGRVIALGERDCSTQRRNQKIIEETPAPGLSDDTRSRLHAAAVTLGEAVHYRSAGTVEFVYDIDSARFYFLEVNTRLQVEHGITEEVTGVDLVEWMVRLAAGDRFEWPAVRAAGASMQVRVYAEDPARQFRPSSGLVTHVQFPAGVRVDTWIADGTDVTPFYDPLLAKIITVGADRGEALSRMQTALAGTSIAGIETNLGYLRRLVGGPTFGAGAMTTRSLESFAYAPRTLEVIAPGTQSTIQDLPGRVGYWHVGVPPSGPMDSLSFDLANRALGNAPDAAALEFTVAGPTLIFQFDALICLTGAAMTADIDGRTVEFWTPLVIRAGEVLRLGGLQATGCRTYLAVQGGFDVPLYLGSRATFTLGKFGGHGGRALRAGDVLHVAEPGTDCAPAAVPPASIPVFTNEWDLGVMYGPHGAPDFFTEADIDAFFASTWEVHYNSSRTGVRLIGPKPQWARSDGGEAGLHPSNIHDNAYAIGAVDFTGDMPVILGPDGPSLGGFVCPATVVSTELWKLGQLRPLDRIRFKRVWPGSQRRGTAPDSPILGTLAKLRDRPEVAYRQAGDRYLLVEYGPLVLDLELRLRVHALMTRLQRSGPPGILELTPGIRSLQVHFDHRTLPVARLLEVLVSTEEDLAGIEDLDIETRIVNLPLSWDDAATQLAIDKYMQSVRADAPWCPSNIEFIRRINGLAGVEDVKRIVFDASYLVLGLGDVYLGAPVATPIDPRHRLVTTKYNPARTWTPENAVGIGGAYLCVYGMEGPGGYQFVGRTCQMWNTYRVTAEFERGRPWLLRFFDQIRFYPVSGAELLEFREDFLHGQVGLDIQSGRFSMDEHRRFLSAHATSIGEHKARQQAAFDAERRRWESSGQIGYTADLPQTEEAHGDDLPPGHVAVTSPVSGSVWKITTEVGQRVAVGDTLVLIESMKMELPVTAPVDGVVVQLRCTEGRAVSVAQTVLVLRPGDAQPGDSR